MKEIQPLAKKVTKKATKKKVEPKDKSANADAAPEPEKVFDISKPGESMASSNSKSIIMQPKGAPVQDPMVTPQSVLTKNEPAEQADAVTVATEEKSEIRTTKARIEPLHDVDVSNEAKEDNSSDAEKSDASEAVQNTPKEEPKDVPESTDTHADGDTEGDGASDLTEDGQNTAKSAEELAAQKRRDEAAALVNSKAYFVPIDSVKKRRSLRRLALVVLVVLVILGGLAALDAGMVDIGITPPTDFIPN